MAAVARCRWCCCCCRLSSTASASSAGSRGSGSPLPAVPAAAPQSIHGRTSVLLVACVSLPCVSSGVVSRRLVVWLWFGEDCGCDWQRHIGGAGVVVCAPSSRGLTLSPMGLRAVCENLHFLLLLVQDQGADRRGRCGDVVLFTHPPQRTPPHTISLPTYTCLGPQGAAANTPTPP